MKLNITLLSAAALLLLASCKKEITSANWFLGEWGNKSSEGELTERWKKENDSVYHGESYFVVSGKDTVFAEHIKLEDANGKLAYIVTVPGQNNEQSVRFEMTSSNENQIIFENPEHDYPSKIIYNKVGTDSLVAEISGIQKGKPASEKFRMKKR
ncbi:DUF6265 family protein [Flavobacterium hauense]